MHVAAELDAIVSEIDIAAPPERVFMALTDRSELVRWFTDASCPVKVWEMDPRPGGRYMYATEEGPVAVNGVSEFECHGEILEFAPPRILVYTWIANWHLDQQRKTVVRWELTRTGAGTHVKVTHSGLAQEAASHEDYSGGWPGVLEQLRNFVQGELDTEKENQHGDARDHSRS
jgi:uncharacterized protein YndB with AHSA1/START domain